MQGKIFWSIENNKIAADVVKLSSTAQEVSAQIYLHQYSDAT
jgi:hypothetical protein